MMDFLSCCCPVTAINAPVIFPEGGSKKTEECTEYSLYKKHQPKKAEPLSPLDPKNIKSLTECDRDKTRAEIRETVQKVTKNLLNISKISQIKRMLPSLEEEYADVLSMDLNEDNPIGLTFQGYLEALIEEGKEPQGPRDLSLYLWVISVHREIPMASKIEIIRHTISSSKFSKQEWSEQFFKLPVEVVIPIIQCLAPIQELWDPSVQAVKAQDVKEPQNRVCILSTKSKKPPSKPPEHFLIYSIEETKEAEEAEEAEEKVKKPRAFGEREASAFTVVSNVSKIR